MKVLVTGASGYVGSFTVLRLLEKGHDVIAIDNLHNSYIESLDVACQIADTDNTCTWYNEDVREFGDIVGVFSKEDPDAVIHFAGLKDTRESVSVPGAYYATNVVGTMNVLRAMTFCKANKIIFSSSCTVYDPFDQAFDEESRKNPVTPYGRSKWMCEQIIRDVVDVTDNATGISLRYFNPIGAHQTGKMGECSRRTSNILPILLEVVKGERKLFEIYGDDHLTPDGTCLRDYVHVMDVADAHIKALDYDQSGAFNLGIESEVSVNEMVNMVVEITGKDIPTKVVGAKEGDVPVARCISTKARRYLGWNPKRTVREAIKHEWKWATEHPNGY